MYELNGQTCYDYYAAAKRVGRNHRTIKRWRRENMLMTWHGEMRIVREDVLLSWLRQKPNNSPVHQYRLRAMAAAMTK